MYETVRNVCVFIILTSVINNLLQGSAYRKYLRIASGLMITLVMLQPVMDIMSIGEKYIENLERYMKQLDINDYKNDMNLYISESNDAEIRYYKNMLRKSLEEYVNSKGYILNKCNFKVNEDVSDKGYGDIILIELKVENSGPGIDKTYIDENGEPHTYDEQLAEDIAEYYGISKENVMIR